VEAMAVQPYRFTVEEYQRMGETGILTREDRVELIDGQIVRMTPIGPPHSGTVMALHQMLASLLGDRAVLSVQSPVILSDFSEPEPDVVLLKPPLGTYRQRHPNPDDVLLLIEVADTSGAYDRRVKLPLYAEAGISEYWIVDLERNLIGVHRSPAGNRYVSVEPLALGDRVSPEAFPDIELEVSEILGTT
jgi:Uma2 family endonuclease